MKGMNKFQQNACSSAQKKKKPLFQQKGKYICEQIAGFVNVFVLKTWRSIFFFARESTTILLMECYF
jgi:hypothetical protein